MKEIRTTITTRAIICLPGFSRARVSGKMSRKTSASFAGGLSAVLLFAFALSCPAEEPNPFVNQPPAEKAPKEAAGESIVSLTEHILVPAGKLDAWLEKNPLQGDASILREAVQEWIRNGSARLDQTAFSRGLAGRQYENESTRGQIYATEYEPPEPGEWPVPTAFDTRNLGYTVSGGAGIEGGVMTLSARFEYVGMLLPHHAWSELAERTRQPDDIFIPRFRHINVERTLRDDASQPVSADPFADPFAESTPVPEKAGARELRFDPGKTYLASRSEEDFPPAPVQGNLPGTNTEPAAGENPVTPADPARLVRLIFFRGAVSAPPAPAPVGDAADAADVRHLSLKLVRVPHAVLAGWTRADDLTKIPDLAWSATETLVKSGGATAISDLAAPMHPGSASTIEQVQEVVYPTEYEPGKLVPGAIGGKGRREPSQPTAFETRNAGISMVAEILPDANGPLLKFSIERVKEAPRSVHHRILRDGQWQVDITFPVFVCNRWRSELRVARGQWMFIGSNMDIDAKGNFDPANAVLAFVKLD